MVLVCEASIAQNNMAAVSTEGSTVWVLIRRSRCRTGPPMKALAEPIPLFSQRAEMLSGGAND